jgi:MFS family permease
MPPRILKQRTVAACAIFSTFLAMSLYSHIYYLPFYFQAVQGASAEQSGIRTIPYLVSITLSSIVVGATITTFGPYNPPMWFGGIVFCIGSGLLYTLSPSSSTGHWIGYQILTGIGAGACVQIPFIAVQVVLSEKDMPIGNAVAIFFNSLGGAISVSIAQNIFSNTLITQLPRLAPEVDVQSVISSGATRIRDPGIVPEGSLEGVVLAYNKAVTTAFILPIAVSGMAFLASLAMEWKSVKGKKLMAGGGA